jgi:predicted nuclease with TOPRIM domain
LSPNAVAQTNDGEDRLVRPRATALLLIPAGLVAGGWGEQVRRQSRTLREKQAELREKQAELREEQAELREEQAELREKQAELREGQARLMEQRPHPPS